MSDIDALIAIKRKTGDSDWQTILDHVASTQEWLDRFQGDAATNALRVAQLEREAAGWEIGFDAEHLARITAEKRATDLEDALLKITDHHDRTRANEHSGTCDWIERARALMPK